MIALGTFVLGIVVGFGLAVYLERAW